MLVVVASSFGRERVCAGCKAAILADKKARCWKPFENSPKRMRGVTFRNVDRVARMCKVFNCRSPFEQEEPEVKKPKSQLAKVIEMLSTMSVADFPNAAAARAACELIQAVKDAPELDRLQAKVRQIEDEMRR